MSLQVWLPLNGNLHNQGLATTTFSGTPAWKNYGKLSGKSLNLQNKITCSTPSLNGVQFFSIAFWGRVEANADSTANWMDIIGFTDISTSETSGQFRFETGYGNTAYGGIHWHDNATNAIINGSYTYNTASEYNNWHHIVVTVSDTAVKSYYDGELKQTHTTNLNKGHLNGNWWLGESTTRGCIQDVRIYDYALSDKEVEEIAKGLILHYKLDDSYAETTTMLSSSITTTAYNSSLGKYGYNTDSNLGKVDGLFQGKQCTKVYTLTAGQTAQPYAYFGNLFTSDGTNQPAYKTLSFDYYTTVPTTTWLNIYKLGSGTGTATWKTSNSDGIKTGTYTNSSNSISVKPNEWNHIEVIFHGTTAANAEWGYCINGPAHTTNENYYFLYANIQLEENDHATGYGESMHSNIIYDSSGYNNNGEIIGSLETIAITTQRYSYTTKFDGNTACIKIPYNDINPDRIFTVNLWFYKDALGSKNYETLFGGPSGFEMDTRAGSASTLSLYMASTRGGNVYTPLNLNEWTMITMVRDGVNELYYVNGDLKKTIEAKGMPNGQYRIGAWASDTGQNYYGYISDFRIYATALTAKQILELYHTSATIDNKGNIYAREVIE